MKRRMLGVWCVVEVASLLEAGRAARRSAESAANAPASRAGMRDEEVDRRLSDVRDAGLKQDRG